MSILNADLKRKFEDVFKPKKIAAFSNCCHYGCTDTYADEWCEDPLPSADGITFFKLHLDGTNYFPEIDDVYCMYTSFKHITENWAETLETIAEWLAVLDLTLNDVRITQPPTEATGIRIEFKKFLALEDDDSDKDGSDPDTPATTPPPT